MSACSVSRIYSARLKDTTDTLRLAVNNVGKSHTAPVYFAEAAEKEVEDILRINVNANVRVTKLILPRMIER